MEPVSKSLGMTLRARRTKLGLSQAKVAELTGKTQSQIARLERGLGDPRISSVVQVSRSLGAELVAIPIRLLPAVRHLLVEHEQGSLPPRSAKFVGNDPEDKEDDGNE
jgi:transcriptional regulator with XRE-family HTH domain